jgi:hypothetical protein
VLSPLDSLVWWEVPLGYIALGSFLFLQEQIKDIIIELREEIALALSMAKAWFVQNQSDDEKKGDRNERERGKRAREKRERRDVARLCGQTTCVCILCSYCTVGSCMGFRSFPTICRISCISSSTTDTRLHFAVQSDVVLAASAAA